MSANLWPELRPETAAKIEAALRRGNKIEAITIYREATAADLKNAKDAIDRADSLVPKEAPKPAVKKIPTKRLSMGWVLLILAVLLILILVLLS
jgi:ribosomal protein L7/L12